jgi:hypothetical protein
MIARSLWVHTSVVNKVLGENAITILNMVLTLAHYIYHQLCVVLVMKKNSSPAARGLRPRTPADRNVRSYLQ